MAAGPYTGRLGLADAVSEVSRASRSKMNDLPSRSFDVMIQRAPNVGVSTVQKCSVCGEIG
jgi:hypothetical protein